MTVLAEDENGRFQNNFHNFLDDVWRGWHLVPGGLTRSAPAASWRHGVFYVVAQNLNNGIQYKHLLEFRDHSSWTGWLALPGGLTPSAPSAASGFSREDRILTVVVRGFDGSIFENTTIPAHERDLERLDPGRRREKTPSSPAAISTFDCGRPPVVVRGMDNGFFYNVRAPGLWRPIPGGLTLSAPAAADVDACVPAGGTLGYTASCSCAASMTASITNFYFF